MTNAPLVIFCFEPFQYVAWSKRTVAPGARVISGTVTMHFAEVSGSPDLQMLTTTPVRSSVTESERFVNTKYSPVSPPLPSAGTPSNSKKRRFFSTQLTDGFQSETVFASAPNVFATKYSPVPSHAPLHQSASR